MRFSVTLWAMVLLLTAHVSLARADQIRVAVASNFYATAKLIAHEFEKQTAHTVQLSAGSTGKHFAQIIHGAPYDLLLAADQLRPMTLESRGLVKAGNRLTYATGRLVLWQPGGLQDGSIKTSLLGSYRKLAIANPALAPYGRAAIEVLDSLQIRTLVEDKLVQGENIAQAYQFVASGNAELGLMAFSQMDRSDPQSFILIPANLHRPIYQQMVLLSEKVAAADFFRYLQRPQTQRLIRQAGYDTDDE